jgi:prephenate dehydrogenase
MKFALIGVGLIGGSFARALRAAGKVDVITGFDTQPDTLRRALDLGVIDQAANSAAQAVEQADLVMVATPVGSIGGVFHAIASHLAPTAIVTDVGSTKAAVIEAARDELGSAFERFVPGHPIAGRERSGVEYSEAALFNDKVFVSTPVPATDVEAVHRVEALWRSVGCRVERMTAEEHDCVFASVSHLPHLLAFALLAQVSAKPDAERQFAIAGAGFRDFTRIGLSSPSIWTDVCLANRHALAVELDDYRVLLDRLQRALEAADGDTLNRVFAGGIGRFYFCK